MAISSSFFVTCEPQVFSGNIGDLTCLDNAFMDDMASSIRLILNPKASNHEQAVTSYVKRREMLRQEHMKRATIVLALIFIMLNVTPVVQADTWVTKAPMPIPNPNFGSVTGGVINGQLFVLGSFSTAVSVATNVNQAYDPGTDTWTSKAPDTGGGGRGRGLVAVGVIDGKLYVAGGCAGDDCNLPTNQLTVYDPTTDTWTAKTPMPTARGGARAGVINGLLYVVGGKTTCCAASQLATLEVYDPLSDTWTTKTPMPTARATAAAGVIGGKLYVVGGECDGLAVCGGKAATAVLEVYDPATDTWTTKTPMPVALQGGHDAGVLDGKLHVVGVAPTFVVIHDVYDPTTDTWTTATPMPTPRVNMAAAVIGDQLFVVGGSLVFAPFGPTGVNEVFIPLAPPVAGVSVTSPSDGATLFTNFGLALSATPASGMIVHQGTVVPRAVISPDSSLATDVGVSFSNTGGAADSATLTLSVDGPTVGTFTPTTPFTGSSSTTFTGVTLSEGSHTLTATLSLSNTAGSSTASSSITVTVSSTVNSLSSLSFTVSGPATATYSGKLTFQVTSGSTVIAEGNLAASAPSFSSLTLPTSISSGQSLVLQEPISISVTSPGTITVTVSVTANGNTQTASVTFTGQP